MGITDSACCSCQEAHYQDIDSPLVIISSPEKTYSFSSKEIKTPIPSIAMDSFTQSVTTSIHIDSTLQKVIKFNKYEYRIEQVIQRMMKYDCIQDCSFKNDLLQIRGKDNKSLKKILPKFEFVCWRIPVTNAFHSNVNNKEILFDRLLQLNTPPLCTLPPVLSGEFPNMSRSLSTLNTPKEVGKKMKRRRSLTSKKLSAINLSFSELKMEEIFIKNNQQLNDEIWDVFNKETFVDIFGQGIYDELPCIPKNAYEYLGHRNSYFNIFYFLCFSILYANNKTRNEFVSIVCVLYIQ